MKQQQSHFVKLFSLNGGRNVPMDYDDTDSQGHNLNSTGEWNSKSSPVLHPYAFDFDGSLQGHLRFDSLVENEVFLGISCQEDNQWIEDFSQGNSGIDFSSSAKESCSISRCNNIWSEATSPESVAMLLKSVGQEERIQGETTIKESDIGNELGRLNTEMEPNLNQDDKLEDLTNSQPTELPDNFPDGRNLNAIESQKDTPVDGSSGDVSNVSIVVTVSEANVGSDKKCDETSQLVVNNLDKSLVDNLVGFSSEIHVHNVISLSQSNTASSSQLDGQENVHQVTDACFETVDGLVTDVPQRIMEEQNIRSTESNKVDLISSGTGGDTCTHNVENPHFVDSNLESLVEHKAESNITSFDEPKAASDLKIEEACKSDKGSTEPSQQGFVEVGGCNKGEKNCKPLQDSLHESSVACLDDTGVEGSKNVVKEMFSSSSDTPSGLPLLSGDNPTANGVTLSEQGQNSQVTNLLGFDDVSQVANDLELVSLPESGQEQAAAIGCSTKVEVCSVLFDSKVKQVDGTAATAAAACKSHEETLMESNAEVALRVVADAVLLSSQSVVPAESVSVSMLEPSFYMIQKDHEVIITSRSQSTGNPRTKVESAEDNQASVALACPSKCIAECVNKDGDASANSVEENPDPPSVISFAKTPFGENGQQLRTSEASVGSVQHSEATHGAGGKVESVPLYFQHDASGEGRSNTSEKDVKGCPFEGIPDPPSIVSCEKTPLSETAHQLRTKQVSVGTVLHSEVTPDANEIVQSVSLDMELDDSNEGKSIALKVGSSTGLSEGETIMRSQSYPSVQVHKKSTDVKGYPFEGNLDPPSVISCAKTPVSENEQKLRTKEVLVGTVQHSEATPDACRKVQSVAMHMQHDDFNDGKNITFEVSSSTGLSGGETIKGSHSNPRVQVHKKSTDVKGYTLASDCSQRDITMVPENFQGSGPMLGKKRAGAKGTSERKTRRGSVKTSPRENAKKGGHVEETPAKQFEGEDTSMMFLDSPGTAHVQFEELNPSSNAEQSGANSCGVLPILASNIPDLNTSVAPAAYLQQPFTDLQHVQLRAQILVHGSLMQNSVPEEACMISAFGQSNDDGCLWEPAWRACSERIRSQKSHGSDLETPAQSRSGSRGPDQPVKNSSLQSKTPSPAGEASSKGISSPVDNPSIPLSSPLWNVSTPCDGLQSSGTFVHYYQPFAPMQLYHPPGIRGFVEQSPSWLSQLPFPGQWVASPQTFALDVNARVSLIPCTGPLKLAPPNILSVPNHPAIEQATQIPVSTGGGGVGVSSGTSSQTDVNKVSVLSGQNSANPKPKKRKKFPVSTSPGQVPLLTLNQVASVTPVSDESNQISEKVTATQPVVQKSLLAQNLPEMGSPVVNNVLSTSISDTTACFASTSNSGNNLTSVSSILLSNQPTRVDQIAEKKGILSEETLNAVKVARLQAEDAAAHAAAAVSNCNDVWSQLTKLNNSGLRSDDETKLSSAAMAIAAASSVAKAAAAAAKLASNVAVEAKLMADEVSITTVTENNTGSTEISLSRASNSLPVAGEGKFSASSIIAAAKETVKKRVEAATAASKHAENLDAIVKASEVAAAAVSQAGTIVSIGDPLPFSELVDSGPMNYWRIPHVSPERGAKAHIDQSKTFENGMVEGCLVEVFKGGGTRKAAWYSAKILNLKDGNAFVCYTELQADEGSGKLKEWVPLNGDGVKAPTVRIAHPTTSMGYHGSRKRQRAAVVDYTWCVGDRVDAWMEDCWLEGFVKEKNKIDETTLTIYFPALEDALAIKMWHLRPARTWQDGKWIEWPTASRKSPSQGDTPQEKRAKLGHLAMEAAKEKDKISRGFSVVESKQHEESRPLPLSANEKEFNIGNNTRDNILDAQRAATGLQKEGSRVVFGVPKPGKKQKFMDISKHLDSDQSTKVTKTSDSIKFARNLMPQGSGGRSWNNKTTADIKEKQTAENKPKALRSGKSQSTLGRALHQKITSLVSAKSTDKVIEENSSGQQELREFGSVSDSQDTSVGPTLVSSQGLPRVSRKKVSSSDAKSVKLNKEKVAAAGGDMGKKVEQDKSFSRVAEPRRSIRKIQPTSRLLEGLQSSLMASKLPSATQEKFQRNQNRGNFKGNSKIHK